MKGACLVGLFAKSKKTASIVRCDHILKKDEYLCSACRYNLKKNARVCPNCGRKLKGTERKPDWVDELEIAEILGI